MPDLPPYALTAVAIAIPLVGLWLLSLKLRDSSIVDIFWGLGFVVIAWVSLLAARPAHPRAYLVAGATTVWGVRLAGYLAWRNLGKGEDKRYAAMRRAHGDRWPLRSLLIVFGLQGVLMWIVSLPLQAAAGAHAAAPLGLLDAAGGLLAAAGVLFEAIADWQLARFKKDPANRGQVMTRGLFRYTRHPNYFGDFLMWWGLFAITAAAGAFWTVISPCLMSFLLLRVSGVPLLEQEMRKRPGYDAYMARTPAFFPWWPKA